MAEVRMTEGMDFINNWLQYIPDVVPPFCVELVLVDGSHFFLHSVNALDVETGSALIRVWDFRAMESDDIEKLKLSLNDVEDRRALDKPGGIHPNLECASLRVTLDKIMYCIEWRDRLWPEEDRPPVGFQ
jgi:hypothetical protein